MKTIGLSALLVVVALVVWYAVVGREWLKRQPWAAGFFAVVEPIEIALYKKSETILLARFKVAVGLLLTLLTQFGEIDLTPLLPFVPEKYQGAAQFAINLLPMLISFIGLVDERLRNTTTKPLDLVALPELQELPPEVATAVAEAEVAKDVAVAAVKQEKASA